MLYRTTCLCSIRSYSTLAEKLRAVVSEDIVAKKQKVESDSSIAIDLQDSSFNEMFVMPKRKLRGQYLLEQASGRASVAQTSRPDIHDRLAVRRPRSEDMAVDQDWTAVWPAARTYASSVVPLPIRMGSRPHPEKRAPFKKEGNLELVKIPNFLHLTPAAIEKHCNAIKKFCTEFPPELVENEDLANSAFPLKIGYNSYVHQGTNIRDNRARVITLQVKLTALQLSSFARDKLIRLASSRYDEKTDTLTVITDRCYTRKQNLDYAFYLLTAIYHEANKVEPWEVMKQREDSLKLEFEGSETQKKLFRLLRHVTSHDKFVENYAVISLHPNLTWFYDSPVKSLHTSTSDEQLLVDPNIQKFANMWNKYMNSEETPESIREYAEGIKSLLGLKPPSEHRL
ncbi:hypothetical protein DICVIV_08057 [Dictyocaulus viviparus]|uniref:Small ribosomal subunit protein mS35 mitochondrial conserved domain-containing protein n=1 Tax=Dictyocaulus viviparus TaxID=29172 RepID=A0A0D8XQ75_DICVI|nr:hypothetical protein DICVIV_08057 [Dictyocaulus viviparus]